MKASCGTCHPEQSTATSPRAGGALTKALAARRHDARSRVTARWRGAPDERRCHSARNVTVHLRKISVPVHRYGGEVKVQ
jgi:hypothetical protein